MKRDVAKVHDATRKAATGRLVSVAAQLEYARYHGSNATKKSALWSELASLLETLGARYACPRCGPDPTR